MQKTSWSPWVTLLLVVASYAGCLLPVGVIRVPGAILLAAILPGWCLWLCLDSHWGVRRLDVTGQVASGTTVCFEYPSAEGEPLYPMRTGENEKVHRLYARLAAEDARKTPQIYLVGRLAEYRY